MVGTISPVVYGPPPHSRWSRHISIYALSQIVGAAVTGFVFATLGVLLRRIHVWDISQLLAPLGFVAAFAALCDLKLLRVRLPSRNWQVPQGWKRFPPSVMAACFGFIIGMGVVTRIPFASFYSVLFACVAVGSVPAAVVLLALYGAARAGALALIARGQAFAPNPHERLETIARLGPVIGYLEGLGLALFAALLLGQATLFHF